MSATYVNNHLPQIIRRNINIILYQFIMRQNKITKTEQIIGFCIIFIWKEIKQKTNWQRCITDVLEICSCMKTRKTTNGERFNLFSHEHHEWFLMHTNNGTYPFHLIKWILNRFEHMTVYVCVNWVCIDTHTSANCAQLKMSFMLQ